MIKSTPHHWLASGMLLGAILTFGILITTPRYEADLLVYAGLITGLGLVIISFIAFLGIETRKFWHKTKSTSQIINNSIRQAFELTLIIFVLAALYSLNTLTLWEAALLIMAIIIFEIIISFKRTF